MSVLCKNENKEKIRKSNQKTKWKKKITKENEQQTKQEKQNHLQ